MGYKMTANDRWAKTRAQTLQASVVKTVTFNSTGVELGDQSTLRLTLAITAASGTTPTLNAKIQTSVDNATWVDVPSGAFAQLTAVSTARLVVSALDRFVRVVATIAGTTPSFTYSVSGESC